MNDPEVPAALMRDILYLIKCLIRNDLREFRVLRTSKGIKVFRTEENGYEL